MTTNQFNLLINEHTSALQSYAMKFTNDFDDAQDLMQDTILKAIRYYHKFEEGTNIRGWLFVIMKNTFINNYRKNTKVQGIVTQQDEISSHNLVFSASKNGAEGSFAMQDISHALDKLPETYRIPFVRFVEGYKYEEIAEDLRIPLGTVKTRIFQAREQLKKQLQIYKERIN